MPAQCNYCRHFHFAVKGPASCAAFPDGVPREIRGNEFDHRLEYPGDQGIRFEPIDEDRLERFEKLMGMDETASKLMPLTAYIDGNGP